MVPSAYQTDTPWQLVPPAFQDRRQGNSSVTSRHLIVTIPVGFQTAATRLEWRGSERGVTSYRNVFRNEPIRNLFGRIPKTIPREIPDVVSVWSRDPSTKEGSGLFVASRLISKIAVLTNQEPFR